MAFLDVLKQKWISRNPLLIIAIGFGASLLGTGTALVVFPRDVGLMGLAFAALILQPLVARLVTFEEERDFRKKRISRQIFQDHSQTFKTILLLFFGILLAYALMGLYLNELRVKTFFSPQLEPYLNPSDRVSLECFLDFDCFLLSRADTSADLRVIGTDGRIESLFGDNAPRQPVGNAGQAAFQCTPGWGCFYQYVANNTVVLVIVLLLSCFYGAGAMLYLAYNASAWGTIFAFVARESVTGGSKIGAFSSLFAKVFPHTLLEASSYFLAVISGVVVMKALLKETDPARVRFVLKDAVVFFFLAIIVMLIAAFVEAFVFR